MYLYVKLDIFVVPTNNPKSQRCDVICMYAYVESRFNVVKYEGIA